MAYWTTTQQVDQSRDSAIVKIKVATGRYKGLR